MEGSEAIVISNAEGKRTTPSVVAFIEGGERKVGVRLNVRRSPIQPKPYTQLKDLWETHLMKLKWKVQESLMRLLRKNNTQELKLMTENIVHKKYLLSFFRK